LDGLFGSSKAGEGILVVDGNRGSATTLTTTASKPATVATRASAFTTTSTASSAAVATVAAITAITAITTVGAITSSTATAAAVAAPTSTRLPRLLLEAVVDIDALLGVASTITLTSTLLLTLKVGLLGAALERLGGIPLIVLLALVGSTSFLDTEIGQLVGGLFGKIVGVRL
jgi:hypothetical protein